MKKKILLEAVTDNLYPLLDIVDEELNKAECDQAVITDVNICIEEIFVNIASYAYGEQKGQAEMEVTIEDQLFSMIFKDSGIPYNPLERKTPDIGAGVQERKVGGLGVYMVKKMMDSVSYDYKEGMNCLKITKTIK